MELNDDMTASPAPAGPLPCPRCGWPETDVYEVVSRHRTSTGVILYTRCVCGLLQVRRVASSRPARPLARGAAPAPAVALDPIDSAASPCHSR